MRQSVFFFSSRFIGVAAAIDETRQAEKKKTLEGVFVVWGVMNFDPVATLDMWPITASDLYTGPLFLSVHVHPAVNLIYWKHKLLKSSFKDIRRLIVSAYGLSAAVAPWRGDLWPHTFVCETEVWQLLPPNRLKVVLITKHFVVAAAECEAQCMNESISLQGGWGGWGGVVFRLTLEG